MSVKHIHLGCTVFATLKGDSGNIRSARMLNDLNHTHLLFQVSFEEAQLY